LIENEIDCVDEGSVEVSVSKKVNVVQGIQELIVNHIVTLVHGVYEDEGQSETGN
jgi:hypothetical protein